MSREVNSIQGQWKTVKHSSDFFLHWPKNILPNLRFKKKKKKSLRNNLFGMPFLENVTCVEPSGASGQAWHLVKGDRLISQLEAIWDKHIRQGVCLSARRLFLTLLFAPSNHRTLPLCPPSHPPRRCTRAQMNLRSAKTSWSSLQMPSWREVTSCAAETASWR